MLKLSVELCHSNVTVAPEETVGVLTLIIGSGILPLHIVCIDGEIVPADIMFSITVIVETAEQPSGVVISNFTVIEELKVGDGVAKYVTDVWVTPAVTV